MVNWFISLLLASSTVRISFALRTSTYRLFFVLFPGLSLSGYLLGSCVRMASGHPAPHCLVSGTFAAGVLLSAPRCPVRASSASALPFFVCPFPGIQCRLSFRPFRRMSSGFLGLTADTLVYILHTRVGVYSFRKRVSACQPSASTFYIAISIYLL